MSKAIMMIIEWHRKKACLTYSKHEIKASGENMLEHMQEDFDYIFPKLNESQGEQDSTSDISERYVWYYSLLRL